MNAILKHVQAKIEELGLEQAALYYSVGPGARLSGAKLEKMVKDEEPLSGRIAVKVCEDLEKECHFHKTAFEGLKMMHGDRLATPIQFDDLQAENSALRARVATMENQRVPLTTSQVLPVAQPFAPGLPPDETPCPVQPWGMPNVNGVAVAPEAPFEEVR